MNQASNEPSDKVTVLVFKDNYAARTFQIPLVWISRLGILLGLIIGLTITSVVIALKYYRIAVASNPARVLDLEQELIDLKTNIKSSETTHPNTAANPAAQTASSRFPLFAPGFGTTLPDPATLPISLQETKISWRGGFLKLRFAIEYRKEDGGSQQGRILILARGPSTLTTYPAGALNSVTAGYLLSPEKGEEFNVSRFREVKASLGPVASQKDLKEIEIFILNQENQPLIYQSLPVSSTGNSNPTVAEPTLPKANAAEPSPAPENQHDGQ